MWQYKKSKAKFKGSYELDKAGERNFILTGVKAPYRRVTFESFQSAMKNGWVKCK